VRHREHDQGAEMTRARALAPLVRTRGLWRRRWGL